MPASDQDIVKGVDFTGIPQANAALLNQHVDEADVAADKGLIVTTTDTAEEVPDLPDVVTYSKFKRYIWRRIPFNTLADQQPRLYTWDDNAAVDPILSQWALLNQSEIALMVADEVDAYIESGVLPVPDKSVTPRKTNFDYEITGWGDTIRLAGKLPVFDIIIKKPIFDPRAFGAFDDGTEPVGGNSAAFRRAIYAAAAAGGIIKVSSGLYIIDLHDENEVYGVDESTPYMPTIGGVACCYQDRNPSKGGLGAKLACFAIPLLDNTILTSDGGAILQIKANTIPANNVIDNIIFTARGRINVIIENLIMDGNSDVQALRRNNAAYPTFTVVDGNGDKWVALGNKSILRYCTFRNTVGLAMLTSANTIVDYVPCLTLDYGRSEMFAVACVSDNEIYGNKFDKLFTAGIAVSGSKNKIYNNEFSNVLGINVGLSHPRFSSLSNNNMAYWLDYKFNPQTYYRGYNVGTILALNKPFFGNGLTDAQLALLEANDNFLDSAWNYWVLENVIEGNIFKNFGWHAVNLEFSAGTVVKNNTFRYGVPKLLRVPTGLTNFNYPDGESSIFKYTGMDCVVGSGVNIDITIDSNTIFMSNENRINGTYDDDLKYNSDPFRRPIRPFVLRGYNYLFGFKLSQPAAEYQEQRSQECICITNNIIKPAVNRSATTLDSGYEAQAIELFGIAYPNTNNNAVESPYYRGGACSMNACNKAVTEFELNELLPMFNVGLRLCFKGSGRFINKNFDPLVDPNSQEYQTVYRNTPTNYYGTRRRTIRQLILRRNAMWQIDCNIKITKSDDAAYLAHIAGQIHFKYTAAAFEYNNEISLLDFRDGCIEFLPVHDGLLPGNLYANHTNQLTPAYRGGINVYYSPYVVDEYGCTSNTVVSMNNNLVIDFQWNIKEV